MSAADLVARIEQARHQHQTATNLFSEIGKIIEKTIVLIVKVAEAIGIQELKGNLQEIMPNASSENIEKYAEHLHSAMRDYGITTPARQQAFLAQLAQESGQFLYKEELASGQKYEGRGDLGNTQSGDGVRYKGRGLIQITGRANYREAGQTLGVDLENYPERAAEPELAARVAAWYWQSRGLNELADQGDFREITRRINGGDNGYEDRLAFYERAQSVIN